MPNRVREYFASRAVAEEAMGNFAVDPRVAAAHAEMAERYRQLAEEFDINRPDGFRVQRPWDLAILPRLNPA